MCVGAKTYFYFYALAVSGALLFTWQAIACALVAAGPWAAPGASSAAIITSSVASFVALAGILSFGPLLAFHTYLLSQGLGTYDWLLRRAEEAAAADDRAAAASAAAASAGAAGEAAHVVRRFPPHDEAAPADAADVALGTGLEGGGSGGGGAGSGAAANPSTLIVASPSTSASPDGMDGGVRADNALPPAVPVAVATVLDALQTFKEALAGLVPGGGEGGGGGDGAAAP